MLKLILALFLSVIAALLIGPHLLTFLRKLHFGQSMYELGPKSHQVKQGTPIMGGFMFIISTVITSIAGYWIYRWKTGIDTTDKDSFKPFYLLLSVLVFSAAFGLIGFIDDYTKVARKKKPCLPSSPPAWGCS